MRSKLNAAARAAYCGVECAIGSARDTDVVARSLSPRARLGHGHQGGGRPASARPQRWVGGIAYPMGSIGINREAERSLRAGSTLFLSGVKRVDGDFEPGAVVELVDVRHPERLIGRGSVVDASAVSCGCCARCRPTRSPTCCRSCSGCGTRARLGNDRPARPAAVRRRQRICIRRELAGRQAGHAELARPRPERVRGAHRRAAAGPAAGVRGDAGGRLLPRRARSARIRRPAARSATCTPCTATRSWCSVVLTATPRRNGRLTAARADLAGAPGHVLDAGQRLKPHRTAGVQLLRGHPDLKPVAELAAVGEPGRAVHEHAARVDRPGEPAGRGDVLRHDRLGVPGAPPGDVGERLRRGRRRPAPPGSGPGTRCAQSLSSAGSASGQIARTRSSPRTITPSLCSSPSASGSQRSARSRAWTSSVSAALHTLGREVLAFTTMVVAMARSADAST